MKDGLVYVGIATAKLLVGGSLDDFVYLLSGQSFEDIAKMPQEQKMVYMAILYHNMTPQLYLAGMATKVIASVGLMGLYWEQGTGVASIKGHAANMIGQYENMSNTLEHLAQDTLPAHEATKFKEFDLTVRQHMAEMTVRPRLVALYRANPGMTIEQYIAKISAEDAGIYHSEKNSKIASAQKAYLANVIETLKSQKSQ